MPPYQVLSSETIIENGQLITNETRHYLDGSTATLRNGVMQSVLTTNGGTQVWPTLTSPRIGTLVVNEGRPIGILGSNGSLVQSGSTQMQLPLQIEEGYGFGILNEAAQAEVMRNIGTPIPFTPITEEFPSVSVYNPTGHLSLRDIQNSIETLKSLNHVPYTIIMHPSTFVELTRSNLTSGYVQDNGTIHGLPIRTTLRAIGISIEYKPASEFTFKAEYTGKFIEDSISEEPKGRVRTLIEEFQDYE